MNMYGHKLIKLPMPQYIVFYNGTEQIPDDHTLVLSDAFESDPTANEMEPALECKARVMNVNSGHNAELMNKCRRLMHYSLFIARIRQNTNNGMSVEQAIDEAITYCIEHDILKDVLLKNRSEVRHMLLTEHKRVIVWDLFCAVIKYNILRHRQLDKLMPIHIQIVQLNVFIIQLCKIKQSPDRHVWIHGRLMFIQIHRRRNNK